PSYRKRGEMSITYPMNMFEGNLVHKGLDKCALPRYDVNILIMYAIGGQPAQMFFERTGGRFHGKDLSERHGTHRQDPASQGEQFHRGQ
ncbi:MAG: hypothetical protein ACI4OD_08550, partial [Selenomonas sp.]